MKLGVAAAVVDGSLVRGDVEIENGRIAEVGLAGGRSGIATPGFVDLQVNGFRGIDLLHATGDEVERLGVELARTGVLWYQPTLITAPTELTRLALSTIGECAAAPRNDGAARTLGVHLEGPFLSPERPGAHPSEHLRRPDLDLLASYLVAGSAVSMVTLAPELPRAGELIDSLLGRGITVSLGHTDADAATAHAAFDQGAQTVTHLFNAMRPFGQRDPGLVGAALVRDDVVVQLIADGAHLAPETILATWRAARGRIALVSDVTAAGGMGDGSFRLGTVHITVEGGVARDDDGALAGATRPLAWGLRMLIELGVPIVEAVDAVTRTPARVVGRPDVGILRPGAAADLVVLDDDFAVASVFVRGRPIQG
ncbi:N-acetylglucosamine-6-phosphate deacetylase [Gaiella sp.]|uniref:N-acetylglucosamine-6-phosphate deacetylase n=1 Tax=Gaiella sp. TaxID=2663207 RepID=UPI0039833443